ncbi:hypothetical protein PQX77_017849 [Marasmius sp. AFHP31]|nr:hypothetical protein PQX77_017849 [Marasmius sp. AFHP31]
MSSEFFQNSRDFTITGGHFSQVQGNQVIHSTTTTIIQGKQKEVSIFDEVRNVKRGDICRIRTIHVDKYLNRYRFSWKKGRDVDRIICVAELDGKQSRLFTVVSYTGPEAREEFEEDFRSYFNLLSPNGLQIYAIDAGTIPSLIFWNELVPAAQFMRHVGFIGRLYFHTLRWQSECTSPSELWMDPARGTLCRGPPGPKPDLPWSVFRLWPEEREDVPWDAGLLQEDAFLRFVASLETKIVDFRFLSAIASASRPRIVASEGISQVTVLSSLTNTTIAVGTSVWGSYSSNRLTEHVSELLPNGLTRQVCRSHSTILLRLMHLILRFELISRDEGRTSIVLNWSADILVSWLAQAGTLLQDHEKEFQENADLSEYEIVVPSARLTGTLPASKWKYRQQIFLFVHPPIPHLRSGETSSLHYWSLDAEGRTALSPCVCRWLDLPVTLQYDYLGCSSHSWSNNEYKLIRQYQILRGFDPTTTYFAQNLIGCYYTFRPVDGSSDRFREVEQEKPPLPVSASTPRSKGLWSSVVSSFLSTVPDNPDILTVGF